MHLPENRNGRPTSPKVEAASVSDDDLNTPIVRPRCRVCGHTIWTAISVLTGLGRDCRRAVLRASREVAA